MTDNYNYSSSIVFGITIGTASFGYRLIVEAKSFRPNNNVIRCVILYEQIIGTILYSFIRTIYCYPDVELTMNKFS